MYNWMPIGLPCEAAANALPAVLVARNAAVPQSAERVRNCLRDIVMGFSPGWPG